MAYTRIQIINTLLARDWNDVINRFNRLDLDQIYNDLILDGFSKRESYTLSQSIYDELN